ncbi:MAG: 3'-5' exoribonuclease YhaM family protein [Ruminococcus sp.]
MLNNEIYTKFSEAQIGTTINRPVLVSSIIENTARNGNTFVKITVRDGFSEITALIFDTSAAKLEAAGICNETIADVQMSVSEYQGAKSFKILEIKPTADTSLSVNDFTKLPPVDLDLMYDEICSLIKSAADNCSDKYTPLSELALQILDEHKSSYITSSASISMHHNLRGGLLYHSYRMVKAADALCSVYTGLDRELMLCGTALHDIGKVWEYKTSLSGNAEFTSGGVLFGHIYMGASLIKGYTKDRNYNMEKVQLLIHMILSHHGTQEWGAVSCPAIPEAFALHYIDNLDAKIYACENFYESLEPGSITEKKPFGFDNRIYKPNL